MAAHRTALRSLLVGQTHRKEGAINTPMTSAEFDRDRKDRIEFLANLLLAANGILTSGVKATFVEKYGGTRVPSPTLVSAQKRLGIHTPKAPREPRESETGQGTDFGLGELQAMFRRVQTLRDQKDQHERHITAIEKELEQLKPAVRALEVARDAVRTIREAVRSTT